MSHKAGATQKPNTAANTNRIGNQGIGARVRFRGLLAAWGLGFGLATAVGIMGHRAVSDGLTGFDPHEVQAGDSGILRRMATRVPAFEWLTGTFEFVGECVLLVVDAFRRVWRPPFETREWVQQMAFVGVSSVPIVALTTFSSGAVLALYLSKFLVQYGVGGLSGATIGLSVVREIAPVISAIMVAARCGSAMSAQIGTMAVTEQVDALKSLNVHPTNYLVIPRLAASLIMVPVLGLVGCYAGIAGGYLVAVYLNNVSSGAFLTSLKLSLNPSDITNCLIKSAVFGFIVAIVACQQGLKTDGGAVGVGRTTTRSVVLSMVLIYVADYFLSQAMFL